MQTAEIYEQPFAGIAEDPPTKLPQVAKKIEARRVNRAKDGDGGYILYV